MSFDYGIRLGNKVSKPRSRRAYLIVWGAIQVEWREGDGPIISSEHRLEMLNLADSDTMLWTDLLTDYRTVEYRATPVNQ